MLILNAEYSCSHIRKLLSFCFRFVQGQVNDPLPVALTASELNISGLYLLHDFVSLEEEGVSMLTHALFTLFVTDIIPCDVFLLLVS